MRKHINVRLQYKDKRFSSALFKPLFTDSFFKPVALAAIQGSACFLSGYALENFLGRYRHYLNEQSFITISNRREFGEQKYIDSLVNKISSLDNITLSLSPFETKDTTNDITVIKSPALNPQILQELDFWLNDFPLASVEIYGAVNVTAKNKDEHWKNAFQKLFPAGYPFAVGFPIVEIYISPISPRQPETFFITVSGSSDIWLQDSVVFKTQIGENEANQNLAGLVDIVELFTKDQEVKPEVISMSIEGSNFLKEKNRIKAAFSRIEGLVLEE